MNPAQEKRRKNNRRGGADPRLPQLQIPRL